MDINELRAAIASPAQKLAKRALDLIRSRGSLEKLRALVDAGAADKIFKFKGRTRFTTISLLAECVGGDFGVISSKKLPDGGTSARLGPIPFDAALLPHFEFLLSRGFRGDSNGWRGELFHYLLQAACWDGGAAADFLRAAIRAGRVDVAARIKGGEYAWQKSWESVALVRELGVDLNDLGNSALQYFGCSETSNEVGRKDLLEYLLNEGAIPSPRDEGRSSSEWYNREKLEACGLLPRLIALGVYPEVPHPDYSAYIERKRQSSMN